jgi:uncharacterized protein (TIGR00288 family)
VEEKLKIAVFIDYDNIEIGVKSTLGREFDVAAVLEGLKERGEIVTKVAYANWGRQSSATRAMTENGVQMVQRDPSPRGDKNGADINLALDALEMAFTRDHINTFAIVSGDSDFMALVEKLKEYNKRVFIVGGKAFTSTILQRNCHEFLSYEALLDIPVRARGAGQAQRQQPSSSRRAAPQSLPLEHSLPLVDRALNALERREVTPQLGLLKSTMIQLDPAFTERDYGTSSFSDFVQRLADAGHLKLHRQENNLLVERLPAPREAPPPPAPSRDDAIPLLRSMLEDALGILRVGLPARELAALFGAAYPDFQLQDYGFTEFEELLNLAQDKGLLRNEAEGERGLRVYPGAELEHAAPAQEPAGPPPVEVEEPPKKAARRRSGGSRRSSSSGRRRSARKAEPES